MDLGLGGKAALVTGGSEGIGMAVARKLAQEGVRVAICARTEATLREMATAITKATGVEVIPIPADLRALAGCQGFVAWMEVLHRGYEGYVAKDPESPYVPGRSLKWLKVRVLNSQEGERGW